MLDLLYNKKSHRVYECEEWGIWVQLKRGDREDKINMIFIYRILNESINK